MDPRAPIAAATPVERRSYVRGEPLVVDGALRWPPTTPPVEATRRDLELPTHERDREIGLLRLDGRTVTRPRAACVLNLPLASHCPHPPLWRGDVSTKPGQG